MASTVVLAVTVMLAVTVAVAAAVAAAMAVALAVNAAVVPRGSRPTALAAAFALALLAPAAAYARPEVTTDLGVTYGRRSAGGSTEGLFGLDLHASLLGDRESARAFAAGGTVHVGAFDFAELHAGVGGTVLLPIVDGWPIVLEALPVLVADEQGLRSGVVGRLFFGAHGFPRLGAYVVTAGLVVETRWLFAGAGHPEALDVHVGVDVDGFSLLWPWMFLWEAIFGG